MGQDANSSWGRRVAILIHQDLHYMQTTKGDCLDADYLLATGRWQEIRIPMNDGADMFVATLYGYPGTGQDAQVHNDNENLIAHAVLRQKTMGDVPYFLTGDFNVNSMNSNVLTTSIRKRYTYDVFNDIYANAPPPTYRKGGTDKDKHKTP